jgi:hypothetical protein
MLPDFYPMTEAAEVAGKSQCGAFRHRALYTRRESQASELI